MALPPLYSIKVFESVARLGNMSAAAVELHVTIGAVSQQVKALQDGLGVALFEKRGRQLVLTDIGHTLRQRVSGALDEINEAVQVVQNSAKQASEQIELTLSIPPIEGVAWLARPLFSFMEESRSIKLNVIKATKFSQVDWRKADVAVVYGTPPWPGFWWRLLHGIHMTPSAARSSFVAIRPFAVSSTSHGIDCCMRTMAPSGSIGSPRRVTPEQELRTSTLKTSVWCCRLQEMVSVLRSVTGWYRPVTSMRATGAAPVILSSGCA